ncbi:MAG: OmpA family protein [Myxococcales bacterium]|nr:OmpA family protein [Myxococcales bacterium]
MRRTQLPALTAFCLLFAASASAQDGRFALDRYEPAERGSDWFANESLDLRGNGRLALGAIGDYAYKPLVFYDANGDEQAAVVEHQLFVHLGGAVVLFDRLRLGANLPLLAYTKGESLNVGNSSFSSNNKSSIGDLRLGADLRLVGEYGGPLSLAIGVQGFVPTGSQDAFASDGKVRIRPRLMAAGDIGSLAYAAQAGINYRARNENLGGDPFGSELTFSAAIGVRAMDKKLIIGPEVFGSTVVSDSGDGAFKKRTTPLEVIIGGKYRVTDDFRVGAGVGPGLTRGVGAPAVRVLASLEWFPEVEKKAAPSDRDKDGILDQDDACPDTPGVRTDDPKTHGCPPAAAPSDRDGDGILDADDACIDVPGVKSDDPKKNGCPLPADRDGDGITDDKDACPDEKGVANADPAKNGCPEVKDRDGDGILDPDDACPDQAGPADPNPKKNGCPKAQISAGQIKILEQVQFATNSAKILSESDAILNAVLKILQDHPELTQVGVEGHTDNRGGKGYNKDLSKRRAASVVKWLVEKGIDKTRLSSAGFGQERPVDSNDTAEGRQNNRRVEFHIQSKEKGSTEIKSK